MSSFDIQTSARSFSPSGTIVIRMVPGATTVPGVCVARSLTMPACGRAQLEQPVAVLLLRELLAQRSACGASLGALGLQLAAVIGADLREALLRLRDGRPAPRRW